MKLAKAAAHAILRALPLRWSRAIRYRYYHGSWPDLKNPVGINEKIHWRVLFDQREIWDWTCDKVRSKIEAQRRSPGILVPEVIWSGTDPHELSDLALDGRWIFKSNRSSKDVFIGDGPPDPAELVDFMKRWDDFQWKDLGESAYAHAAPVAVVERWISDSPEAPLDYKVFVYDGVARYIHVHRARFSGHRSSLFTRDWVRVASRQSHIVPDEIDLPKPEHLAELLTRAEQIGAGFDFVRVDLYDTADGVWFGEVTPYSWSGFRPFTPASVEVELGSYWTLPDLPTRRVPPRRVG